MINVMTCNDTQVFAQSLYIFCFSYVKRWCVKTTIAKDTFDTETLFLPYLIITNEAKFVGYNKIIRW